jgi:hypothetical protein
MLEPWIIEQIRRREEEERRKQDRPQLDIPAEDERIEQWRKRRDDERRIDRDRPSEDSDDAPKRGVMIIDFG